MTPKCLATTPQRMKLLFIEMGKAEGRADLRRWGVEKQDKIRGSVVDIQSFIPFQTLKIKWMVKLY